MSYSHIPIYDQYMRGPMGGVKAELRREPENKAERRGTIEADAMTGEEVE